MAPRGWEVAVREIEIGGGQGGDGAATSPIRPQNNDPESLANPHSDADQPGFDQPREQKVRMGNRWAVDRKPASN